MYGFAGFLHFPGSPTRRPAKTPILDFALAATVIPRKIGAWINFHISQRCNRRSADADLVRYPRRTFDG